MSDQGQLQAVQSVIDYGLPTEPYQFLVDGAGIVRASFQGIASADEIRAALDCACSRAAESPERTASTTITGLSGALVPVEPGATSGSPAAQAGQVAGPGS